MKKGRIYIYITLIITIFLWVISKENFVSDFLATPQTFVGQIASLLGTVLLSWSFFTSTRFKFLENWFGGLDKVYKEHKNISIWGFSFISIHLLVIIFNNLESFLSWEKFIDFKEYNDGVGAGIISFIIFAILIAMALLFKKIKIKYHYWKFFHKFISIAMFFALLHILKIKSDVSFFEPLGLWIKFIVIIALICGIYKTFFYKYFGPKFKYKIVDIKKDNDIYDIHLKPLEGKKLNFEAGQFVYMSFLNSEKVSKEQHPFSIASSPDNEIMRIVIKKLGDFTSNLDSVKVGEFVDLYGPYGKMGSRFFKDSKDAILVGGGVGITPFVSLFEKANSDNNDKKVTLFYSTNFKKEAYFDKELEGISTKNNNLTYIQHSSKENNLGYLGVEDIFEKIEDVNNTIIYICGPPAMMKSLSGGLQKRGFKKENIVFEDFSML